MYIVVSRSFVIGLVLSLLLLSISCTKITQSSDPTNTREKTEQWALIVGAGEDEDPGVDTCYADKDAKAFCKQLEPIFGNNHVKLLVNSSATKISFRNAIFDWLDPKEDEDDVVLFFLVGHGNHEYFELYDSPNELQQNNISPLELNMWLDALESKNIVIIMDFCESGSFSYNISRIGCVIITGCTGYEKCWQEKAYEHGVFSYYLIESFSHLEEVDIDEDYEISAEEIFTYVQKKLEHEFKRYPPSSPQHPHICNYHDGDLILFKIEVSPDVQIRPLPGRYWVSANTRLLE